MLRKPQAGADGKPRWAWLAWLGLVVGLLAAGWGGREFRRWGLLRRHYLPAPAGMVLVPAGEFLMGSDDPRAEPDERPLRRLFLPAFYIDRCEVTNAEYRRVVPTHAYPEGADALPASRITRAEAEAYCRAVGKRLPAAAEWEKAARGTDGRRYPWGDEYAPAKANVKADAESAEGLAPGQCEALPDGPERGKKPVGSCPQGASPYGCLDMAGNVWEWVSDIHPAWPLRWLHSAVPSGILRGGAHGYGAFATRTSYQGFEGLESTCNDVGFRGALDAVPAPR